MASTCCGSSSSISWATAGNHNVGHHQRRRENGAIQGEKVLLTRSQQGEEQGGRKVQEGPDMKKETRKHVQIATHQKGTDHSRDKNDQTSPGETGHTRKGKGITTIQHHHAVVESVRTGVIQKRDRHFSRVTCTILSGRISGTQGISSNTLGSAGW